MAPRKTARKEVGPKKTTIETPRAIGTKASKHLQAGLDATNPNTPPSNISLDITSHPYILQQVINESSPSSLATLIQCSKHLFQKTAPVLYRYPRNSPQQFKAMIETGKDPLVRRSTSGMLGRSYSPFLHEALQHVESLHITDYKVNVPLPVIPRRCFTSISTLVLHFTAVQWNRPYPLKVESKLLSIKPSHIVIRCPDDARGKADRSPMMFVTGPLPPSTSHLTIMTSFGQDTPMAPWIEIGGHHFDSSSIFVPVTIVLLPVQPLLGTLPPGYGDTAWRQSFCVPLGNNSCLRSVRVVGGEYYGFTSHDKTLISQCPLPPLIPNYWRPPSIRRLEFKRFIDWLDEQEPGSIFNAEETLALREADRALIAQAKALAPMFTT